MDRITNDNSTDSSLGLLVKRAVRSLEELGYSRRSLGRYRTVWRHLIDFACQEQLADGFSEGLSQRFFKKHGLPKEGTDKPLKGWRRHIRFAIKLLGDFAQQGRLERPRADMRRIRVVPAMRGTLREYEQFCKDKLQLRPWTIRSRARELTIFSDFLHSRKGKAFDQIEAVDLSEFICSRDHLKPKTVSRVISDLRSFLRFLTMRGILRKDLSPDLPKIRVPKDAHIPSVWDHELIVKLLAAIDRSSPRGKRDYAILLLACRLGLRAGDIRTLQLDHIRWEDSRIDIIQSKTNTPLSLPLTEEVGQALIDYLRSGRPKTTHREVFLKLTSPFEPFSRNNLYHIVTYWRGQADISLPTQASRGLHSLRHSLATRLLENGTPFHTISEILGHATLESTRIYAKADVEALRSVALDSEEISHVE